MGFFRSFCNKFCNKNSSQTSTEKTPTEKTPPPEGSDKIIREMIQHENYLINVRMGWMIALQGLLFTALGLIAKADKPDIHNAIIQWIPIIGYFVALFTIWGISNALHAIRGLVAWWDGHYLINYNDPDVIGLRFKSKQHKFYQTFLWLVIPFLFLIVWFFLVLVIDYYLFDELAKFSHSIRRFFYG